jgi:hypothetical protein
MSRATIEIAILDASLDDPQWPRDSADVLDYLARARAHAARCSFRAADLDAWNWDTQAITLSAVSTQRLLAALPADSELSAPVRQMKAMHEQLGWGNPIGLQLQTRGFLVSLRGKALYGGVFLEAVSERRVDVPVLRTTLAGARAVFNVLPVHLPFLIADPGTTEREITIDEVAPEARQDWPVARMMARLAYGAEAVRQRVVVRDNSLRAALQDAGRLVEN